MATEKEYHDKNDNDETEILSVSSYATNLGALDTLRSVN